MEHEDAPGNDIQATTEAADGGIKDEYDEHLALPENDGGSQKRMRNTKSKGITLSCLEQYFGKLPLGDVAKKLGVSKTTLRTCCRKHRIPTWPYYRKRNVNTICNRGNVNIVRPRGNVNTVRNRGNVNIVHDQGNVNVVRDQGNVNIVRDESPVAESFYDDLGDITIMPELN